MVAPRFAGFCRDGHIATAFKGQPWGQFRHNPTLIHRRDVFFEVVRFAATAPKRGCPQRLGFSKPLSRNKKMPLSTAKGGPYYYY
jgi:hypothetical protein